MAVLTAEALQMNLPKMIKIRQKFNADYIPDIKKALRKQLEQEKIRSLVRSGESIAVGVGSRGIANIDKIVRETIDFLKENGAQPFIVPAMGSHGRACAEGQKEILQSFGITEETMGVPIRSSLEVSLLGNTLNGIPVYMDKNALSADMTVVIGRVKPHTAFKGPIESGLCKMLAIGLGKHIGCSRLHEEGWTDFSNVIASVAEVLLTEANIGFGIALVENAHEQTAIIRVAIKDDLLRCDRELQQKSKEMMPSLLLPDFDVLIVERIGKNISGSGMDPNIIGRSSSLGKMPDYKGPQIKRIVALDLSAETHGNVCGIGSADFITEKMFNNIDFESTYANTVASGSPEAARIPIIMQTEREAIIAAVKCCGKTAKDGPRIVRIQDTLHLQDIWVSENMLPLIAGNDRLEIIA